MDFGSLILVIGAGATIDVLADIQQKKNELIPIVGAALLIVILGAVGRATGQWGIVTAVAFLYLLASALKNYSMLSAYTNALKGASNG